MMDILKNLGLTTCALTVITLILTAPGFAMNDDDPLKKTPPSQSLNMKVLSTQTLKSLSTSWGRPESGNTRGVADFQGGPLSGVPCQSPLPFTTMTHEQREEIDQHIRLIQCRIKNCCGPKADQ